MTGGLSLWQLLFGVMGKPLLIVLLPVYLFALIKGDRTDRLIVHVLAIGAVLNFTLALHQQASGQTGQYKGDQLIIDVLLLAATTFIATRSSRRYPIVMAATQLNIVLAELLSWVGLIAHEKTLSMLIGFAAVIQLGTFAWGLTVQQIQRRHTAFAETLAH